MSRLPYLLLLASMIVRAQEPEVTPRQVWNEEFLKKRPSGNTATPPPRIEYRAVPVPKAAPPAGKATPTSNAAASPRAGTVAPAKGQEATAGLTLGLTLWRLRSPKPVGARLLLLESSGAASGEVTPERVESDTVLANGDKVRLTVEVPATGYFYVVDREQYADGDYSEPFLIYPNWQTRAGDNTLAPGRLIEIPDQRDQPNHFTVRSMRPDQVAENLYLLISPEPIPDLKAGRTPLPVDRNRFMDWERNWSVTNERFELHDGTGAVWTSREKAAGNKETVLTQDDVMPQTLYRVQRKSGSPMLIKVSLHLK